MYRDNNMPLADTYYGVPIPSQLEVECLQVELFGESPASLEACIGVAEEICMRRPAVIDMGKVIVEEFVDMEGGEQSGFEDRVATEGFQVGYSVGLGVIGYLNYVRDTTTSGQGLLSFTDYLDGLPKRSPVLPLRKACQLRRVEQYLEEDTVMSTLLLDDVEKTSIDLTFMHMAELDYDAYMSRADWLGEVIKCELRLVGLRVVDMLRAYYASTGQDAAPHQDRYNLAGRFQASADSGFASILEVYIQSYIQDRLVRTRAKEGFPSGRTVPAVLEQISANNDGDIL